MKLNDLVQKDVVREVVYDKDYKVSFKLKFIPRSEVQAMMGRNTKIDFDKKTHKSEANLNGESFTKEMVKSVVKGWSGITPKYLSTIVPLDMTKVKNENEEIDFNEENLMFLLENSYDFGSWIVDTVRDASNFSEKKEAEVKN